VAVGRTRNLNRQAGTVGVRRYPTVIRHNPTSDYVGLHGNGSETGDTVVVTAADNQPIFQPLIG